MHISKIFLQNSCWVMICTLPVPLQVWSSQFQNWSFTEIKRFYWLVLFEYWTSEDTSICSWPTSRRLASNDFIYIQIIICRKQPLQKPRNTIVTNAHMCTCLIDRVCWMQFQFTIRQGGDHFVSYSTFYNPSH